MRTAIGDAGGDEVFFRGRLVGEKVTAVEVLAVGNRGAVNAFVDRVGPGEVMLHNHPSGELRPSDADLDIAGRAGAHGAGFFIVDNSVARVRPVVLPWTPEVFVPLDADDVAGLLGPDGPLAGALPGYQTRSGQIDLCRAIAKRLSGGGIGVFEAGTGIGKSFAYLLPAIRMARANDTTVVV
ncbi:MAG: helicase, partial [Candidatus Dadabacteria bacterium]